MKRTRISVMTALLLSILLFASVLPVSAEEEKTDSSQAASGSEEEFPVHHLSAAGADSYSEMKAQDRILSAAYDRGITVSTTNDCARWVFLVYSKANVSCPYLSGAALWAGLGSPANTEMNDIPVGAIVIGTGHNSNVLNKDFYFGHVGICLGDIDGDGVLDVRDCTGPGEEGIHTSDIRTWASWQTDTIFGDTEWDPGFVGWVYPLQ